MYFDWDQRTRHKCIFNQVVQVGDRHSSEYNEFTLEKKIL